MPRTNAPERLALVVLLVAGGVFAARLAGVGGLTTGLQDAPISEYQVSGGSVTP